MKPRRAFTLLELIVSIAIAGIIALLVYGSASAGLDTRDALARHRATAESELRTRILLADALRHASDEASVGAAVFQLVKGADVRGVASDELTFTTRGILPPLGASPRWTVTLKPTAAGLLLRAAPLDDDAGEPAPGMSTVLAHVRGVDVEVMRAADRTWSTVWQSGNQLPVAVRVTLMDMSGAPVGAPIVARLGLENVP